MQQLNTKTHTFVSLLKPNIYMETRKHIAAACKQSGTHNCAQSVLCTYPEITGLDDATARNIGASFAAGMGNMEGTCGALVGAGIVLGCALKDKAAAMKAQRRVMTKFQQRNGATQCRLLKGVGQPCPLRECPDCVADACEFLEAELP